MACDDASCDRGGHLSVTTEMISDAEIVYANWHTENQGCFLDGGFGDVADLLVRLSPIFEKAAKSASVTPGAEARFTRGIRKALKTPPTKHADQQGKKPPNVPIQAKGRRKDE